MTTEVKLSGPARLLLAAHELEALSTRPFTASELIVRAWQKFPKTFGLEHYASEYPDSHKVLSIIAGKKGLVGKGLFCRPLPKSYSLTQAGRTAVRKLLGSEPAPFEAKA